MINLDDYPHMHAFALITCHVFAIFDRYGVDLNSTAVEDVSCTYSSYLSISQCSLSSQYSSNCSSDSYDLVVTCCKFPCIVLFCMYVH